MAMARDNNKGAALAGDRQSIRIYKLDRDINHGCTVTELDPQLDLNMNKSKSGMSPFRLSLHILDSGEIGYSFSLPDGSMSEVFNKNDMNGISRELKVLMDGAKGYSYHVTEVSLDNIAVPMYRNYTSLAFSEKNRFELMVEKGLQIL